MLGWYSEKDTVHLHSTIPEDASVTVHHMDMDAPTDYQNVNTVLQYTFKHIVLSFFPASPMPLSNI